jgi:hypothetical protein
LKIDKVTVSLRHKCPLLAHPPCTIDSTACGNLCIFNAGQHVDFWFLTGISYWKKVPATSDPLKFVLERQAINLVLWKYDYCSFVNM